MKTKEVGVGTLFAGGVVAGGIGLSLMFGGVANANEGVPAPNVVGDNAGATGGGQQAPAAPSVSSPDTGGGGGVEEAPSAPAAPSLTPDYAPTPDYTPSPDYSTPPAPSSPSVPVTPDVTEQPAAPSLPESGSTAPTAPALPPTVPGDSQQDQVRDRNTTKGNSLAWTGFESTDPKLLEGINDSGKYLLGTSLVIGALTVGVVVYRRKRYEVGPERVTISPVSAGPPR